MCLHKFLLCSPFPISRHLPFWFTTHDLWGWLFQFSWTQSSNKASVFLFLSTITEQKKEGKVDESYRTKVNQGVFHHMSLGSAQLERAAHFMGFCLGTVPPERESYVDKSACLWAATGDNVSQHVSIKMLCSPLHQFGKANLTPLWIWDPSDVKHCLLSEQTES